MQKNVERTEALQKEVDKTGLSVDEFAKRMQGLASSFDKLTQSVDKNTAAQNKVAEAGKKAADAEKQGADKATDAIDKTGKATDELGRKLKNTGDEGAEGFGKLQKAAAGFFTVAAAKEFAGKVFQVRSEIESLETSFRVLVGEKDKADALFSSIREFATKTPMQMKDLASAAQTMMQFNIPVEQIMENLKALGDVSMGDAQKFQSLSLAFAQMSSTGKLMGQDLLQMINAGFNPLATMSEKTGKSISELKDEMSKGAISADMVRQAFIDATSEGGKFAGMLEKQSHTLAGAYSNLEGAILDMFNAIGEQSEGIMMGAIDVATTLAQNYEKVGKVIIGLVGTYGVYKAAVMAVNVVKAIEDNYNKKVAAAKLAETAATTTATGAKVAEAAATKSLSAAQLIHHGRIMLVQKAHALLNATMLSNPYVLAATALAGLVAVMWNMKSTQDLVNEAQDEYNRKKEEEIAKEKEHMNKINELIEVAGNEALSTDARRDAMIVLMQKYPALFQNYNTEIEALKDIAFWKAKIAEIESGKSITLAQNELYNVNKRINELEAKGKGKARYSAFTRKGGRTSEEEIELIQLKKQRAEINKQVKADADKNYLKNLTGVSNEELQRQITERKSLIAKISVAEQQGKKMVGKTQIGGVVGVYTKEELESQTKILEWEQNRRQEIIKNSTKDFKKESTKARQQAQNDLKSWEALTDPKKRAKSKLEVDGKKVSEMNDSEFFEVLEKRQKAYEEAKKKEDAYNKAANGGATPKKTKEKVDHTAEQEAQQDAQRRQKLFDLAQKEKERQANEEANLEGILADLKIASEKDASKREQMQREKDHKERLAEIDRQVEEWKKANYQAAKEEWEAKNKDKKTSFADTEEGKDGWEGQKLTETQEKTRKAMLQKETEDEKRAAEERAQSLISAHQSYTDRKIQLDKEYAETVRQIDEEIAKAKERNDQESVDALTRTKQQAATDHAKDQSALSLDILKESPEYIRAFEDLQQTSSETLEYLIEEFEKAKDAAAQGLDPKDLKEYTDTIQRMNDELNSRNPFKAMREASLEMKEAHEEVVAAEKEVEDAEKQLAQVREKGSHWVVTIDKSTGKLVATYMTEKKAQENVTKAKKKKITATDKERKATEKHRKAEKEAIDAVEELCDAVSNLGSVIGGSAGEIISLIGDVGSFAVNVINTVNQIIENVQAVAEEASAAIKAVESASVILAVIGAALQIMQKLTSMFGANYDEYNELVGQYENLIDVWDELIDRKQEYIKISYGSEVTKVGKEVIALLEEETKAWRKLGKERLNAGASAGSRSIGVRSRDDMDDQDWIAVAKSLGRSTENWVGLGGRLEGLFDLSVEQLTKLREDVPAFWAKLDEDVRNYLNDIIDGAERIAEQEALMKERITGLSFDTAFDDLMDYMYEVADGSEDVMDDIAENWQQMINRMVVSNIIGNRMREELEKWYNELYEMQAAKSKELSDLEDDLKNKRITEYSYNISLDDINKRYEESIEKAKKGYSDIVDSGKKEIEELTELGIIKPIEDATDEIKVYFEDLKDSWKETLSDMSATTEDWKNELIDQVLSDLVESTILNAPFDTMIDGAEKHFDDFGKYLEDWTDRYKGVLEDETLSDEERTKKLKALIDEQTNLREKQAEKSRQLAEGLGKDMTEAFSNSLDNLGDTLLDALLNAGDDAEKAAEDLGKQIGSTLIKEMLQELLAQEKYADRIATIKEHWQKALKGEDGYTYDSVMGEIVDLNNDIANDDAIGVLADQWKALNKQMDESKSLFDGIKSSFTSAMMDIKKTSEDFGQEIGKTIAQKIIEEMVVSSAIQPLIDNLQKAFDAARSVQGATYTDIINDEGVQAAMTALKDAFPDLQQTAKEIMEGMGVKMNEEAKQGFSDLKGTFVSTLTDMEADAETLGKNLGKSMMEQMLNAMVEKKYSEDLKKINDEWADALEAGDPAKIEEIKQKAEALFSTIENDTSIKKLADEIKSLTDDSTSPFDSLRSSFLSALTDMTTSTKDFTKEISTMIAKSFVDSFVLGEQFDAKLAEWKKKYKDITTNAGLSEEQRMRELRGLSNLISQERDNMQAEVTDIYKMLGIKDGQDQSATMNMAEAATYDQFELYLGMATSHLMVAEQTKGITQQILDTLNAMSNVTGGTNYGEQIFMRLGTTNEYLLAVKKATEGIRSEFSVKLDRMNAQLAKWG